MLWRNVHQLGLFGISRNKSRMENPSQFLNVHFFGFCTASAKLQKECIGATPIVHLVHEKRQSRCPLLLAVRSTPMGIHGNQSAMRQNESDTAFFTVTSFGVLAYLLVKGDRLWLLAGSCERISKGDDCSFTHIVIVMLFHWTGFLCIWVISCCPAIFDDTTVVF